MRLPALRVLIVCVLVAGTGWGAVVDQSPITAENELTEPRPGNVTVVGDSGGVYVDRAYRRIQRLFGTNAGEMIVTFRQDSGVDLQETYPDPFFELFADPTIRIVRPVAGAGGPERVSVSYSNATPRAFVERVLVHEFGHAFQPPTLREGLKATAGDYANTTDSTLARSAMLEGPAVFVADEYVDRYLPSVRNESEVLAEEWPTMADGTRLLWAPYRYGAHYVHSRVRSPGQLDPLYVDPPHTTEQLLHPNQDESERLPLSVRSNDAASDWNRRAVDTRGELYLRILLGSELPEKRAASAAAGWGNDRLLTYTNGTDQSYAWVLRWDNPREAEQFETALSDHLNATATRGDDGWSTGDVAFRYGRVTNETSYVLAGDPGFVRTAQVDGTDSNVTLTP